MKTSTFLFALLCVTTPVPALSRSRRLMMGSSSKVTHEVVNNEYHYHYYDVPDINQQEFNEGDENNYHYYDEKEEEHYTSEGCIEYGYSEAKMKWSDSSRGYNCDNIDNDYWVKCVQENIFAMCDSKWPASSYAHDCKSGAVQYTIETMDSCFGTVVTLSGWY
jgi:hypothetical protein